MSQRARIAVPDPRRPPRQAAAGPAANRTPASASAHILHLQRLAGNSQVTRLLIQRAGGWSGQDVAGRGATSAALGSPKPAGWGWNAGEHAVGGMRRIPVDGLTQGNSHPSPMAETGETAQQRAILLVPDNLDPTLTQVEIFLHLHGHGVGFRQRQRDGGAGKSVGSVRDVDLDRFEQQIQASGRTMVGVLPQGTGLSSFGAGPGGSFTDTDAYLREIFDRAKTLGALPPDIQPGRVVLSGHSGAGNPLSEMMKHDTLPSGLKEVILWDAINGPGEYSKIEKWVLTQMDNARAALPLVSAMALVVGADPAAAQQDYLASRALRFRGYHTGPDNAKPDTSLAKDGGTYASRYAALKQAIEKWLNHKANAAALGGAGAPLWNLMKDNFQIIARPGVTHEQLMGQGDKLTDELTALP